MSASFRTKRARFYEPTPVNQDGWTGTTYAFTEERWVSLDIVSGRARSLGDVPQTDYDAVLGVDDRITVAPEMVVRVGSTYYHVQAVIPRASARELAVYLLTSGDPAVATTLLVTPTTLPLTMPVPASATPTPASLALENPPAPASATPTPASLTLDAQPAPSSATPTPASLTLDAP